MVRFTVWGLVLPFIVLLPGIIGLIAVIRYARRVRTRPTLVWAVASATGIALSLGTQLALPFVVSMVKDPGRLVAMTSLVYGVQGFLGFAIGLTGSIALVLVLRDAGKHYEEFAERSEATQSRGEPT